MVCARANAAMQASTANAFNAMVPVLVAVPRAADVVDEEEEEEEQDN